MGRNHAILSSTVGLLPRCRASVRAGSALIPTLTRPGSPLEKEELIPRLCRSQGASCFRYNSARRDSRCTRRGIYARNRDFLIFLAVFMKRRVITTTSRNRQNCGSPLEINIFFFFWNSSKDTEERRAYRFSLKRILYITRAIALNGGYVATADSSDDLRSRFSIRSSNQRSRTMLRANVALWIIYEHYVVARVMLFEDLWPRIIFPLRSFAKKNGT